MLCSGCKHKVRIADPHRGVYIQSRERRYIGNHDVMMSNLLSNKGECESGN